MEIKCPLCTAEQSPSELTVQCLERSDEGELRLKKNCDYYYQVQAQIHVCSLVYSDFLVWSPYGVHIERIYPDSDLFSIALKEIKTFYVYCFTRDRWEMVYSPKYHHDDLHESCSKFSR